MANELQISVHIWQLPGVQGYQDVTSSGFYLPILKVDEHAELTDSLARQWEKQVGLALKIREAAHYVGIIGGAVLLAFGAVAAGGLRLEYLRHHSYDQLD